MDITVTMKCDELHKQKVTLWSVGFDEDMELVFSAGDGWHVCFICETLGLGGQMLPNGEWSGKGCAMPESAQVAACEEAVNAMAVQFEKKRQGKPFLTDLESVGTGISSEGWTYPMMTDGGYDESNAIHISDIEPDGDWFNGLSDADWATVKANFEARMERAAHRTTGRLTMR